MSGESIRQLAGLSRHWLTRLLTGKRVPSCNQCFNSNFMMIVTRIVHRLNITYREPPPLLPPALPRAKTCSRLLITLDRAARFLATWRWKKVLREGDTRQSTR